MRASSCLAMLPLAAALVSCGSAVRGPDDVAPDATLPAGTGLIDQAHALQPAERATIARRLFAMGGERPTVVIVKVEPGTSIEQVGWAVRPHGDFAKRPVLLVDPVSRRVRVEGLAPERGAAIASAMAPLLEMQRVGAAIEAGLSVYWTSRA